jgi:hypothetical protein
MTSLHPQLLDGLDKRLGEQTGLSEDYITNRLPKVSSEQVVTALSEIQHWKQ